MTSVCRYSSPMGMLLLSADEIGLTGLWFEGQKHYATTLEKAIPEETTPVLRRAMDWLDVYFSGKEPDFSVPVHFVGTTFQVQVWSMLQEIPYGRMTTYGQLARKLSETMSAQAVGNAVGKNPVSIIVPCHRVVGAKGQMTGFAAGIDIKKRLLQLESAL